MYICSMLLYRSYLSVYSPSLLIVDLHSVVCLTPLCAGRLDESHVPRAFSHKNCVSLYKSWQLQTIKRT